MIISYNWLKELVDFELPITQLADRLTMAGLEVEKITDLGADFHNIVIGKILSIKNHPQAEKLKVCQVDIGKEEPLQIVCGAPNCAVGQKVPVALIGAKLNPTFTVKKVKLRGIESYGMICAEDELGISNDHSGIMVIQENKADISVGENFAMALGFDDNMIEIEVTPNRPDLLGMIGIARETAIIANSEYRIPKIMLSESDEKTEDNISVEIKDTRLCPRYCARIIKNVEIKSSPLWLKRRLNSIGLRPINNVVDVTNFVMWEFGHPLHAFDYDKLTGKKIIVRTGQKGETIQLLDEQTYQLSDENLVIADIERPIALAGIMGGMKSSISENTKNVVLEAAYFLPDSINRTSYNFNIDTDSSHRFERGMDPNILETVIDRAAQLIAETSDGQVCKGIVFGNQRTEKIPLKTCYLRPERANKILATNIKTDQMLYYLNKLNIKTEKIHNDKFKIFVPSFRPDITREIDIIEEIARCYGYDKIDSYYTLPKIEDKRKRISIRKLTNYLVQNGFYEVCNMSFSNVELMKKLNIPENDYRYNYIEIANPIGKEFSIMRTTLIPDLLENAKYNLDQKIEDIKFFELNKIYLKDEANLSVKKRSIHTNQLKRMTKAKEELCLCGLIIGNFYQKHWQRKNTAVDFFDLKGIIQGIGKILMIENEMDFIRSKEPFYHPGKSADVLYNAKKIGSFGVVDKKVSERFDIENDIYLFEINIDLLLKISNKKNIEFQRITRFPPVLRDLAIVAPSNVTVKEIENAIKQTADYIIKKVELFDIYTGNQIEKGCRSLAFSIVFQSDKKTLQDKYIDKLFDKIVINLRNRLNIKMR